MKILLVGDSGVLEIVLVQRFVHDTFEGEPTVGVGFKLKYVDIDGKRLKLTVGHRGTELFRADGSYYRGAHGWYFAYDITSGGFRTSDVWRQRRWTCTVRSRTR